MWKNGLNHHLGHTHLNTWDQVLIQSPVNAPRKLQIMGSRPRMWDLDEVQMQAAVRHPPAAAGMRGGNQQLGSPLCSSAFIFTPTRLLCIFINKTLKKPSWQQKYWQIFKHGIIILNIMYPFPFISEEHSIVCQGAPIKGGHRVFVHDSSVLSEGQCGGYLLLISKKLITT